VGVADAMQGDPSSVVVSRRVEEDCCGGVDVGAGWCCSSRGEAGWNACDGGALGCCCAAGIIKSLMIWSVIIWPAKSKAQIRIHTANLIVGQSFIF
jgi:hypothetical protein